MALATDATPLGLNAAELATRMGVASEINCEEKTDPDLVGLQAFIDAYRSQPPFDPTGQKQAARLTLDFAAGARWLIDIARKATTDRLWVSIHMDSQAAGRLEPARIGAMPDG